VLPFTYCFDERILLFGFYLNQREKRAFVPPPDSSASYQKKLKKQTKTNQKTREGMKK